MVKRLKKCPVCNADLYIREFHCADCDITIKGRFSQSELASLSLAQQEFVKIFLLCQVNIREVEKRLGISYPTVKSRLSEVVKILEGTSNKEQDILQLLDEIEEGNLSVEEVITKIKKERD